MVAAQVEKLAIPRRFTTDMKEIWALQPRLLNALGQPALSPARASALSRGMRFPAAALRQRRGGRRGGQWWERFKDAGEEERSRMLLPDRAGGKRKRRRRPRSKAGGEAATVDPVS